MLVCVDVNLVGLNVSDQLPSLSTVAVPRSVEPPVLRSPKIHTSTESIALAPATGSVTVPLIVYVLPPEADTFDPSRGLPIVSCGGPPVTGAGRGAGAGGGGAGAGAGGGAGAGAGAATGGGAGACMSSSSGKVPLMSPLEIGR